VKPRSNDTPEKVCRICGKKCAALYFLSHVRLGHPAEWDNYINSRAGFGAVVSQHVRVYPVAEAEI